MFEPGDKVQFNAAFQHGPRRVFPDDGGEVVKVSGDGWVTVVADRGGRWIAKMYEIRPAGTPITKDAQRKIKADNDLIAGWIEWESRQ